MAWVHVRAMLLLHLRLRVEAPHEAGHQTNHRALDNARHPASVTPKSSAVLNGPMCMLPTMLTCRSQQETKNDVLFVGSSHISPARVELRGGQPDDAV